MTSLAVSTGSPVAAVDYIEVFVQTMMVAGLQWLLARAAVAVSSLNQRLQWL